MEKSIKCCVIGLGLLGSVHTEKLYGNLKTRLTAVCDIDAKKAKFTGEKYKVNYYTDAAEMFKKEKIDMAVVATQDPYHKDPVINACKAGVKKIICEKPLATTVEDAEQMLEAAEKGKNDIFVLFPNRFYQLDNAVRLIVREGYMGNPLYGEMRLDNNIYVPNKLWGEANKTFAKKSSPVYFLLSHAVDLLRFYFEPYEIIKVYAVGRKSIVGSIVDFVDSYVTFSNGLVLRLKSEWTKSMKQLVEFYVQMTGTSGGFVYNKTPGYKSSPGLRFDLRCGEKQLSEISRKLMEKGIKSTVEISSGELSKYAMEIDADENSEFEWNDGLLKYVDAIWDTQYSSYNITNAQGGLKQVKVIDAILKSINENREIETNI